MPHKYDAETRAKAVRLVLDNRDEYDSEWAAITATASRLGMTAETLRKWARQHDIGHGERDGLTTSEAREIRELKKKNRELEEAGSSDFSGV